MFGTRRPVVHWFCAAVWLLAALALSGCGGSRGYVSSPAYAPTHYYPPPGPPGDPWGPYIREAATRYGIPAQWIRAVMRQESGGEEQAVSPVGAIGLMQVMPSTYQDLEASEGLGGDPFNPHDNILAGAAYIKQMYERFGAPGFLAAYNAGPGEMDNYLAGGGPLPDETVNYLAAVTPNLGNAVPLSGPLAEYASAGGGISPSRNSFATGCDVNAAYDPDQPCAAAPPPADMVEQAAVPAANTGSCNPDAAYDPDNPCGAPPPASAPSPDEAVRNAQIVSAAPPPPDEGSALYQPAVAAPAPMEQAPVLSPAPAPAPPPSPAPAPAPAPRGDWGIQVGAFASPGLARAVAEGAQAEAPRDLAAAAITLSPMQPFGGLTLYRAQLVNLPPAAAIDACSALNRRQLPCVVLPAAGA
jgi:hypothetical protein